MALNREKVHQSAQKLAQKGQLDRAIGELRQILTEDPSDARTLQRIAELYVKMGSYQDATETYLRLAEVFTKAGFYQRSVAVYNQILQLNPTHTKTLVALAETLTRLGLAQEANKIFGRAVHLLQKTDRLDEAAAILTRLIEANPGDYQARLQLAEMFVKVGNNEEAVRAFEEALPILRAQGRDDLFKRAAERLLYYCPDNLALCRELAVFHLRRDNIPQAMKLLQYCHKRDPDDIETLQLLADHFVSTGMLEKAVVVLSQMIRVYGRIGDRVAAQATQARIDEIRSGGAADHAAPDAGWNVPAAPGGRGPSSLRERPVSVDPVDLVDEASATPEEVGSGEIEIADSDLDAEEVAGDETYADEAPYESIEAARGGVPSIPVSAPLPEEPADVVRIATEAGVFVKFGLKDRAVGHLEGGLAQYRDSVVLRDRLIAIHLGGDNIDHAVRVMLELSAILARSHPEHAIRYLQEILVVDEENETARRRLEVLTRSAGGARRDEAARGFDEVPGIEIDGPTPVSEPVMPSLEDIDLDVDLSSGPVRTVTVQSVPAAPRDIVEIQDRRSPYLVDLPPFDEVETGPPFLASPQPAPASVQPRVLVPVDPEPAGPDVLEIDDREFDELFPAGPAGPSRPAGPKVVPLGPMREPGRPTVPPPPAALLGAMPSASAASTAEDPAVAQALEEIDFFQQQGLEDDARMLAEQLAADHGSDPRVRAKLRQLAPVGVGRGAPGQASARVDSAHGPGTPWDEVSEGLEALDAIIGDSIGGPAVDGLKPEGAGTSAAEATMHYDLGVAYREMGVLDRAIEEFRLASQDSDREANCFAMIGSCLVALGKAKGALEELKRGLHARRKSATDEMELFYQLAVACAADNDPKEALFYLQKIKKRDPDFRDVKQRIATLTSTERPGRRPTPRAPQAEIGAGADDSAVDKAFDDLFKDGRD